MGVECEVGATLFGARRRLCFVGIDGGVWSGWSRRWGWASRMAYAAVSERCWGWSAGLMGLGRGCFARVEDLGLAERRERLGAAIIVGAIGMKVGRGDILVEVVLVWFGWEDEGCEVGVMKVL